MEPNFNTTLPDVLGYSSEDMEVREISADRSLYQVIWGWHERRPGFVAGPEDGPESHIGPTWRNYCFFFDGSPAVCVSIQEARPYGYEISVAAAPGTHPKKVRRAIKWVGDLLIQAPSSVRMAAWCPASHRAAVRLNQHFLQHEIFFDLDGVLWRRFGCDSEYWKERHGR